ncbi:hypothetical protein CAJAP_06620 [Camponotus japonicus]
MRTRPAVELRSRARLGGLEVFLCFPFCLVVRHVHRGPLTFPAVPSHGRRVHSEARVVLWAVSRAVSPLKRAIPPSAPSSRIGAPNRTHRVTISRKRDPPYTVPPASSTRGPHCLLVTVVVILVNIVHQRAS